MIVIGVRQIAEQCSVSTYDIRALMVVEHLCSVSNYDGRAPMMVEHLGRGADNQNGNLRWYLP